MKDLFHIKISSTRKLLKLMLKLSSVIVIFVFQEYSCTSIKLFVWNDENVSHAHVSQNAHFTDFTAFSFKIFTKNICFYIQDLKKQKMYCFIYFLHENCPV